MCGGAGYCTSLTTVEPSFIVTELKDAGDKKTFPDIRKKRLLKPGEWNNLQRALDTKSLMAAPEMQRHAEIDWPCSWLQIEFRDGSKLSTMTGRIRLLRWRLCCGKYQLIPFQ